MLERKSRFLTVRLRNRSGWKITSSAMARPPRAALEGLEKGDQRALVVVAQPGLFLEEVGAEIVAAVDHEVRALAQLQQRVHQVGEDLLGLLVAGSRGQRLEVAIHSEQHVTERFGLPRLLGGALAAVREV